MAGAGRTALLAAVTAAILTGTLLPGPTPVPGAASDPANVRGLADALANILLFLPFGIAAALRFRRRVLPIGLGAALSVLIELLQLLVPGRYPAATDVVFNTAGTALGGALVWQFDAWARPRSVWRWLLPIGAVTASVTVLGGSVFLFELAIPPRVLFGQWTAQFEDMAHYDGRVVGAFVGMMPVPSRRIATSGTLRHRLLGGETIRVNFIAGTPPARLAPIFSIFDDRAHEMLLIGADGDDVVVRFRTRARALRLDEPELRVTGALAGVKAGQPASIRMSRELRRYCVAVNDKEWCNVGYTVGDTWGLLLYPIPPLAAIVIPYLWLASLALPAGFWVRHDAALAGVGLLLAATLALAPSWADILPTTFPQFAAALAGTALGSFAGRRVGHASPARRPAMDTFVG